MLVPRTPQPGDLAGEQRLGGGEGHAEYVHAVDEAAEQLEELLGRVGVVEHERVEQREQQRRDLAEREPAGRAARADDDELLGAGDAHRPVRVEQHQVGEEHLEVLVAAEALQAARVQHLATPAC